jgi:hypothetical protein
MCLYQTHGKYKCCDKMCWFHDWHAIEMGFFNKIFKKFTDGWNKLVKYYDKMYEDPDYVEEWDYDKTDTDKRCVLVYYTLNPDNTYKRKIVNFPIFKNLIYYAISNHLLFNLGETPYNFKIYVKKTETTEKKKLFEGTIHQLIRFYMYDEDCKIKTGQDVSDIILNVYERFLKSSRIIPLVYLSICFARDFENSC